MPADIPFRDVRVPTWLTRIYHVVMSVMPPIMMHAVMYSDHDPNGVDAPILCICNERVVPGGLLPSETMWSMLWSYGLIHATGQSIQDPIMYTALCNCLCMWLCRARRYASPQLLCAIPVLLPGPQA